MNQELFNKLQKDYLTVVNDIIYLIHHPEDNSLLHTPNYLTPLRKRDAITGERISIQEQDSVYQYYVQLHGILINALNDQGISTSDATYFRIPNYLRELIRK